MKHTPGPWGIKKVGTSFQVEGINHHGECRAICSLHYQNCCAVNSFPVEANARLIAAAPDLLEALKSIECQLGLCSNPVTSGDDFHKLIQKVIAKAEGK